MRGFGIPQLVWAYESHTDMIARALGIDPVEFRRRNILRDGRPHASDTIMRDAAIDRVLDTIAARMNWSAPFDRGSGILRRGRGVAIGYKAAVAPTTATPRRAPRTAAAPGAAARTTGTRLGAARTTAAVAPARVAPRAAPATRTPAAAAVAPEAAAAATRGPTAAPGGAGERARRSENP